jgi:hypothetical protein
MPKLAAWVMSSRFADSDVRMYGRRFESYGVAMVGSRTAYLNLRFSVEREQGEFRSHFSMGKKEPPCDRREIHHGSSTD